MKTRFKWGRSIVKGLLAVVLGAGCISFVPTSVFGQSDDFNDGDDEGWTRLDPRGGLGAGPQGVYTFPNGNSYRIQTPVNAALNGGGPGRAGGLFGPSYTDFFISVDIIDWDDSSTPQVFGILARVTEPGLGTLDGYTFTYDRQGDDIDIGRVVDESTATANGGAIIGTGALHLDPTKDYRFVFIGKGTEFEGRIYELPDVETPIITVTASDGMYASGRSGIFNFDQSAGTVVTDTTFDNFQVLAAEPPELSIVLNLLGEVEVRWLNEGGSYQLQSTTDLAPPVVWSVVPPDQIFDEPPTGKSHFAGVEPGMKIYRLVQD